MWQPIGNPAGEDGLPQDLRVWVDQSTLVRLVLDAVQSACESEADSRGMTAPIPVGQPRILLTILTYCYAVGLYASEEIEGRISTEASLRYLSAGARPSWHDLRRFRRQNREQIHKALTQVFHIAQQFRLWLIADTLHIDAECCDRLAENCRKPGRADVIRREADDRINQAVLLDSMALDD